MMMEVEKFQDRPYVNWKTGELLVRLRPSPKASEQGS
jgi:hypothetical protein